MKSVIYVDVEIKKASSKCIKALNYVDKNKRITKWEIRGHLKAIFEHLHNAQSAPTKLDHRTDNHETKEEREEREKMPDEYHKSI